MVPASYFIFLDTLSYAKALCSQADFTRAWNECFSLASHFNTIAIFTDGSVNQQSGEAGSAFNCNDYVYSRRIGNGATTLQAELFAIKIAFTYYSSQSVHVPSQL